MIIYKYLTVEKADEWLIGEDSILLTPPKHLNDLLEFRIRREPADVAEKRALFDQFQKEKPSPNLSFERFLLHTTSKEYIDSEPDYLRNGMSEVIGVVSLTSDPSSELMWAHYGLNSGVAIGYKAEEAEELNGLRGRGLPLGLALEVTYDDSVIPTKKDFTDAALRLCTKRKCWEYENEWRILMPLAGATHKERDDKPYYTLPACREQLAHVIFGADAKTDFIERMIDWLEGCPATIQKLRIDPTTHDLVLTDIEKA
jgi:hypothetical protein